VITDISNVKQYDIVTTPAASYAIPYPFFSYADIVATLSFADGSEEVLVLDTDYSLTVPSTTGTLTRIGTWTADATRITIARVASFINDVDFANGSMLDAEVLETLIDRIVGYNQQLKELIARTVTIPITDDAASLVLPNKADRANKALGFDTNGDAIPSATPFLPITTYMTNMLAVTDALTAQLHLELVPTGTASAIATFIKTALATADLQAFQKAIGLIPSGATEAIIVAVQNFLQLGGTSEATAERVVTRDISGRAKFAAPSAEDDVALKSTITTHNAVVNPHGAVSAPTASRLIVRDGGGRAQVSEPSADADIATKKTVTDAIAAKTDQELKTTSSPTFAALTITASEGARTAGSYVIMVAASVTVPTNTYSKVNEFKIKRSGTYTIYMTVSGATGVAVYGKIYKNGSAVGTERLANGDVTNSFSESIAFVSGDLIQIYGKNSSGSPGGNISSKLMCAEEGVLLAYGG
jgi:hypothetical protein